VHQARAATHARISVGDVERGEAGQRQAMPYFFAVLRDLVSNEAAQQSPPHANRANEHR
jgi:hypothetical protein